MVIVELIAYIRAKVNATINVELKKELLNLHKGMMSILRLMDWTEDADNSWSKTTETWSRSGKTKTTRTWKLRSGTATVLLDNLVCNDGYPENEEEDLCPIDIMVYQLAYIDSKMTSLINLTRRQILLHIQENVKKALRTLEWVEGEHNIWTKTTETWSRSGKTKYTVTLTKWSLVIPPNDNVQ